MSFGVGAGAYGCGLALGCAATATATGPLGSGAACKPRRSTSGAGGWAFLKGTQPGSSPGMVCHCQSYPAWFLNTGNVLSSIHTPRGSGALGICVLVLRGLVTMLQNQMLTMGSHMTTHIPSRTNCHYCGHATNTYQCLLPFPMPSCTVEVLMTSATQCPLASAQHKHAQQNSCSKKLG